MVRPSAFDKDPQLASFSSTYVRGCILFDSDFVLVAKGGRR